MRKNKKSCQEETGSPRRFTRFFLAARGIYSVLIMMTLVLTSCTSTAARPPAFPTRPGVTPSAVLSGAATAAAPTAGSNPTGSTTVAPVPTLNQATVEGMFNMPDNVNPLTGLPVSDPSRLERRPVMVKVANFPRSGRPHAGLSFADMVFEYYIGYGLNRFLAIYLSQDCAQVGPVRSGRLVDAQLGELYQGLLFYANADPQVDEVLEKELGPRALAEKYLPSPPKYRIGKVLDETTLFVNTAELTDYVNSHKEVTNTRRDLRGMIFDDQIHPVNQPGTFLGVQFWTTTREEWNYNTELGKYQAKIENPIGDNKIEMIPMVDRLTNEQLAFSNIIILFATYIEYAPTLHDVRLFDNTEGKRAIFFRDGVMSEGTWKTVGNGRPIQFFNSWGLPYHLKQGNSWIVLTGDSSKFNAKDSGGWELRFDLP